MFSVPPSLVRSALLAVLVATLATCAKRGGCTGDYCGTVVFASPPEPETLLPPVAASAIARDVHDQIFLKLADLGTTLNTIGDEDFQPQLAERWEWDDPLTLVFHLDPRARWQDGPPVTASDIAFTFDAYTDSLVASESRPQLRHIR